MAILSFKVQADYEKVVKLREEISKLETQLKGFGKNTPQIEIKAVENRLAEAKAEFTAVASEASKAGAVLSKDFKGKIHESVAVVNNLTAKIIEQKGVVKDAEITVKKLSEAYRSMAKSSDTSKTSELKSELDAAKSKLEGEKAALFSLNQEKAKATLATKKLKEEYSEFKDKAGEAKKESEGFSLSLGKIAGIVGGVTALKQLASQVVAVRGQFQDMETQIETLVGKDVTAKIMPQIKEMAKVSPLTMGDIVGAEKMMLSFNIEAEKSIEFLRALSDVSMGNSQKFNSLTLAFSQMSSAGKLMGQDLLQMINAGFNPLQQISAKTGKSISQLKEEMSKGAISAQMVQQAFLDATSAGGKFYNMSENASKTINGQISMMEDAMDAMFNEIGTKTEGVIIKSIQSVTSLIQNYEKIGQVLASLVGTYGAYRTAVFLATAATSKHTLAEIALTNVRIAARKAQKLLNAAMLTNPYVALAVAVGGLVTAYVALKDNTSAAERAQKEYTAEKEKAAQKEKEHADAIQGLIDKVRDETQAESERVLALMALKDEYPNIFEQYDVESLKLEDILKLKKQINAEDRKRRIEDVKGKIKQLSEEVVVMRGRGASQQNIAVKQEKIAEYRRELLSEDYADFVTSLGGMTDEKLAAITSRLEKISEGTGGFTAKLSGVVVNKENYADFLEKYIAAAKKEQEKRKEVVPIYGTEYKAAEKEWNDAKKALEAIEKDKDKYTTEQYKAAKTRKETAEKAFKELGGDTTGKEIKSEYDKLAQQQKIKDLTEKQARENARAAKDAEFMVEQARIDAMKEGAAKTRAQRLLDYQKELENLERQKQDYILKVVEQEKAIFDAKEEANAKEKKDYKKKVFDKDAAAAKVDTSAYDASAKGVTAKYLANEEELYKNLFEQYMSYTDQKAKLEKEYLEDVLELNMAYLETGDEKYVRSIDERTKVYAQALNKLNKAMNAEDYKLIFGDTNKMTTKGIDVALGKAKDLLSTMSKDTDPETWKVVVEKINELEDVKLNRLFEGWDDSTEGLLRQLIKVQEMKEKIEKKEMSEDDEAFKKAKQDLRKGFAATGATLFSNTLSQAADTMREIADITGDIHLAEQAEQLANASSILSSTASGLASGGPMGALVGFFSGTISSGINSLLNDKVEAAQEYAKAKQALEDYEAEIDRMSRTISEEDYDTIFGVRSLSKVVDASKMATEAYNDYLSALKGTFSYAWDSRGLMMGLENAVTPFKRDGRSGNATLREQFPEIFEYEKNGRGGYDVIGLKLKEAQAALEAYSEYANDKWYKELEAAVSALEDYEEQMAIVDDQLRSLFSNIGSDIVDSIMKGEDALEAIKKSTGDVFAQISKQLVSEMLISEEFITKYTDKWRSALATADNGVDDADVMAAMADELAKNVEDAKAFYEQLKRTAEERDIDMDIMSESQQEASRRGYETLSEDTGNELVGRAVAQYESNLRMEEATRSMKESVDIMMANNVQIRDIASESRALIADSYLELQQIRENTGNSAKYLKIIDERMTEWDSKIKSL